MPKRTRKFLSKLRIAWAFLGKFDCPEYTQRIGFKRAWQIAEMILEFQRPDARA
jgi:hypothetical protein